MLDAKMWLKLLPTEKSEAKAAKHILLPFIPESSLLTVLSLV